LRPDEAFGGIGYPTVLSPSVSKVEPSVEGLDGSSMSLLSPMLFVTDQMLQPQNASMPSSSTGRMMAATLAEASECMCAGSPLVPGTMTWPVV